jgi:NCS2 family nucleobase:cation symporter-2
VIGFAAGGLFLLLGFSPKLSALLSIMPPPVAGAIVIFVVCFMLTSGLQIMLSTKVDSRKTFVIGSALCFGLSLDILPELYAHVAPWLRPLFESSLTLSTVVAVVLHQILRLGARDGATAPAASEGRAVASVQVPAAPGAQVPTVPTDKTAAEGLTLVKA